ncbi:MAG: RNA 2',3'-cyclic phosphodiesterase [archaeon]
MRIFIAVELPDAVRESIKELKADFKLIRSLRFVSKENIHITLKFLGEVSDDRMKLVISALKKVKFSPIKLSLGKIGVFPDEKNIRVLWVDAEPAEPLVRLKETIDAALPRFKDDHPFKTHITIARVGMLSHDDKKRFIELVSSKHVAKKDFSVQKFALFKSTLTPSGPVYEKIAEF